MDDFWRRGDVRIRDIREERTKRSTVEIQQAVRFNLFHILEASARAEDTGVPAKGFTGQAYEGHYFWDTETYLLPFLIYTSPRIAKNLLTFRYKMLPQARAARQAIGPSRRHLPVAHLIFTHPEAARCAVSLDEPTAGMSASETHETIRLLQRISDERGLTLLFTEHDMAVVFGIAQKIAVLHQGHLIADGTPEEVRNDPEVRRVYLGHGLSQ